MSKPEPKYRRPLNKEQLEVLDLLFNYRFSISKQIARYFNKEDIKLVRKRLNILEEQGFVAKRYDSSYKLAGRYAEYYLAPKGAKYLQALRTSNTDKYKEENQIADQAIKNRYKDKTVSQLFMSHSLTVLDLFLHYKDKHGDKIYIFSKVQLQPYDYFIKPLPDLFLSITSKTNRAKDDALKRYFIDYFEDSIPFFIVIRRIKKYITYYEEDEWADDNPPKVLLITESERKQKQVSRRIAKELRDAYMDEEDIDISAICLGAVNTSLHAS
jgi:DNA-binding HxlR family transcriptional regulator